MARDIINTPPRSSRTRILKATRRPPDPFGNRATLVALIARGRRLLDELIGNSTADAESIAAREGCSVRQVNMTISLAFIAPDLVKAAIDGRLPLVEPPPSTHCILCGGELRLKSIQSANQVLGLVNNIYVCANCGHEQMYTTYHDQYAIQKIEKLR